MKETIENIEDNMVRQLPLKQFFKLIIYLLEDNETEENNKLFAPSIPIKYKIPLRYDIFIKSLSFKCSAFIKLIIVCALAGPGNPIVMNPNTIRGKNHHEVLVRIRSPME